MDGAAGRALDVNGAAGRALHGSAEQFSDGAWAARNGCDGLAGLEVTQLGLFQLTELHQHGWYIVYPQEKEQKGV